MKIFATTLLLMIMLTACNLEQTPEDIEPTSDEQSVATATATVTLTPINGTPNVLPVGTRSSSPTEITPPQLDLPLDTEPTATTQPQGNVNESELPPRERFLRQANINVQSGQILVLTHEVEIENPGRGRVFFLLVDPDGVAVWQYIATETEIDSNDVAIQTSGVHELLVSLQNLEGSYQIGYELKR